MEEHMSNDTHTDPKTSPKETKTATRSAELSVTTDPHTHAVHAEVRSERKPKYSRDLKDVQRLERGVAKASRRVGRAVYEGLDLYLERRDRSADKRRDGAIRDALKNWSKGWSKTLREASDAPYDVFKAFNTKAVRRTVKFGVRSFAFPFLR
jgi:hypothetical protein